ncbi:uncharacterized protein [Procambarus clarkii]|uniref:uncharacterized protein n=1 Tax=Procambarus clarkii TaxID=6728 RepID=UPI003743683B
MTAVLNFRGSEKDLARAQKYIDTGDDEILQNCTQEQLWLIGKMYGVRLKSNRASSKRKEIKAITQIDRVSMFCKTHDEKILDMCTRRQIRMLEDHFGLKGGQDKIEDGREALRTWLREQKAEEEKEAKRQREQEETQCQQGGAEALPQNEEPDRLEEISEETDDAPSDEGINVNSSSSRESSLERREMEPKLEPGDNEVQLQREERQARLEQEKAKAEQERAKAEQEKAKAEQEKAKAEQEKAKAEQEKLKVGQERAKAEQETAKAELTMIKMEAAKAEQERIKTARRENRVRSEARCSNGRSSGVWGGRNYERPRRVWGEKNFDKWADKSKYPKTQKSRSRTSSESEDGGAKRETNRYPGNQESSKAPQSTSSTSGPRNSNTSGQSQSYSGTYRRDFPQMRCYNCNGLGHVMRDCRQGKRVVTLAMCDPRSKYIKVFQDKPQRANLVNERYRPFMSKGWIRIGSQPEVEVGILRDTGANQSLIARSLIGNGRRLAGRSKMRVYGLLSESDMPVCTVQLRSEYVSAEVMLGVCPDIPIPGVQVILGNDLCGTKVLPRVVAETVPEECPEGHCTGGTPESVNLTDIRGDESGDRQAIEYPVSVVRKAEVADKEDAGEDDTVSIKPVEDIDVDIAWLFDEGPAQENEVSVRSKVKMAQPKKNHVKRADLSRAQTAEIKSRKVNATVLSRNEERCGHAEDGSRASRCPRAQRHRGSAVLEETFRERRRVEGEEMELYRGEKCGKRKMIQAWRNRGKPRTRGESNRMRSQINEETKRRSVGEDDGVKYDDRRRKYNGSRWKSEDDRGGTDSRCLTLDVKRRRGNGGWRQ